MDDELFQKLCALIYRNNPKDNCQRTSCTQCTECKDYDELFDWAENATAMPTVKQ